MGPWFVFNGLFVFSLRLFLSRYILFNLAGEDSMGPALGGGDSGFHQSRSDNHFAVWEVNSENHRILYDLAKVDEIIMIVEEGSKSLKMSDEDFNAEFDKIYICSKGLKIARDLYR